MTDAHPVENADVGGGVAGSHDDSSPQTEPRGPTALPVRARTVENDLAAGWGRPSGPDGSVCMCARVCLCVCTRVWVCAVTFSTFCNPELKISMLCTGFRVSRYLVVGQASAARTYGDS